MKNTHLSFPRHKRLLTAEHYRQAFNNPKRVSCAELLILFKPNQQAHCRLGLAIAKKQIKRAVDRNKVKRLIRESFRVNQNSFPNIDIVILARKSILNMDNTEIHNMLDKLFKQLVSKYGMH